MLPEGSGLSANRCSRVAVCLAVLVLGSPHALPEDAGEPLPTLDSGLVERTGASVFLLDIEVEDEDGLPMPGLSADDFVLELNGRVYPIYSVDDLCPAAATFTAVDSDSDSAGEAVSRAPVSAPDPARTVLYLDFSQMRPDGRAMAVTEATRWIRAHVAEGNEAMVAAYASIAGLRELTGFTDDAEELVRAVEAANEDRDFLDSFPMAIDLRRELCLSAPRRGAKFPPACLIPMREEASHGRQSLRALKALLEGLAAEPGRKTLILFTQNAHLDPAKLFGVPDLPGYDHYRLAEEIGAEANLARTAIFTANLNDSLGRACSTSELMAGLSANFGANLADYTGGGYSRGQLDVKLATEQAASRPSCVYRIGIEPPPDEGNDVVRIKVWVNDRPIDARYRAMFLDETDRWWRAARRVLARPEDAQDIPVTVALVPLRARRKGWEAAVQVVLDPTSLAAAPVAGRDRRDWEVGVHVSSEPAGDNWEMLGVSRMRLHDPDEKTGTLVLYEHALNGLKPGRYRVAAFVRDRLGGSFGGAQSSLELPRPAGSLVGPLVFEADQQHVMSDLPLLVRKGMTAEARSSTVTRGLVPAGEGPASPATPVEIVSWICPGDSDSQPAPPLRFVSQNGEALFRYENPSEKSAGACTRIADRLETGRLREGTFTYHLRWEVPGAQPIERQVEIRVEADSQSATKRWARSEGGPE